MKKSKFLLSAGDKGEGWEIEDYGYSWKYKLFWQGCKEGVAGEGVLVHQKWIEGVIEVKRMNNEH